MIFAALKQRNDKKRIASEGVVQGNLPRHILSPFPKVVFAESCECYEGYELGDDTPVSCNVHVIDDVRCEPQWWWTTEKPSASVIRSSLESCARTVSTNRSVLKQCLESSLRSWFADNPCTDFECSPNSRCILDENNQPTCACAHSRWSGPLCDTVNCGNGFECFNGGSCER